MASSACPMCRRYVEVPNIDDSQPFTCPYCVLRTPLRLYKCNSCMKVSIVIPNVHRTCPRCYTILRSGQPIGPHLAPPVQAPPQDESRWLYHVTGIDTARKIRVVGLKSAKLRGQDKPDPEGSFVRDFLQRRDMSVKTKLREYVVVMRALDGNLEAIIKNNIKFKPHGLTPTGSNDDYDSLKRWETTVLSAYAKMLAPTKQFNRIPRNLSKDSKDLWAIEWANALGAQSDHVLTRLANEYVDLDFGIEGAITTAHVYFLNTKNPKLIVDGFMDYTKLRKESETAVLRILAINVPDREPDEADHRAVRTKRPVGAMFFDILINPTWKQNFQNSQFRLDSVNWLPLHAWRG